MIHNSKPYSYQPKKTCSDFHSLLNLHTVAPHYNESRYNEELWRGPRYNEWHLKARQNYSKLCGSKPRYNEPRYNEQWFQNKPATAWVPPAPWLYVAGCSGHNSLLVTNNFGVASLRQHSNFTLNFAAIIHMQKDVSVVKKKLKLSVISCAILICVLSLSGRANLVWACDDVVAYFSSSGHFHANCVHTFLIWVQKVTILRWVNK